MLKKFSVENFKGFKDKITLDIGHTAITVLIQRLLRMAVLPKGLSMVLIAVVNQILDWRYLILEASSEL